MKKEYKNLVIFLLIAFLLPFVSLVVQSMISNDFTCFVLYGIQAATPTFSAITVIYLFNKEKTFLVQMFRKEHLRKAIILPIIIVCTTMFLAKLIFCTLFGVDFALGNISAAQLVIILWAFFAEEIGWRGYLEPLLIQSGIHKRLVPCIVGIIWCLWHYHFFLRNGIQVPVPLFLISCIVESYIYSFLMSATSNNIISAMTYHFVWNLIIHIAAVNPVDNNGNIFPYVILVVLEALVLPVVMLLI